MRFLCLRCKSYVNCLKQCDKLITTMRGINAILLDGVQSDELPEDLLLRSL